MQYRLLQYVVHKGIKPIGAYYEVIS